MEKIKTLFICTGNSCRSQMAEGFLHQLAGDRFAAYSAGSFPSDSIHPLAVKVMAEMGMEISRNKTSIKLKAKSPLRGISLEQRFVSTAL
jgi:arsenate reductase